MWYLCDVLVSVGARVRVCVSAGTRVGVIAYVAGSCRLVRVFMSTSMCVRTGRYVCSCDVFRFLLLMSWRSAAVVVLCVAANRWRRRRSMRRRRRAARRRPEVALRAVVAADDPSCVK